MSIRSDRKILNIFIKLLRICLKFSVFEGVEMDNCLQKMISGMAIVVFIRTDIAYPKVNILLLTSSANWIAVLNFVTTAIAMLFIAVWRDLSDRRGKLLINMNMFVRSIWTIAAHDKPRAAFACKYTVLTLSFAIIAYQLLLINLFLLLFYGMHWLIFLLSFCHFLIVYFFYQNAI